MATVTRTIGPLHFEDLEPHRFEDLIRELAYDFRDWQSIEATGRGGNDEGFDIRAFERVSGAHATIDEEDDSEAAGELEGRLWQIQCKRESAIGPSRVAEIIEESVSRDAPPYGFILAAPANFSKKAHDAFRESLRNRGVVEFQLWGRGTLEDFLHQPKNDHILFTFFGISLVTRRRSRTTEIRATIATKNKLKKTLGSHAEVLLRDSNDCSYPYSSEYADFDDRPRWRRYLGVHHDPDGILIETREYFAFYDRKLKQWDYSTEVNLARRPLPDERDALAEEARQRVEAIWEGFPRAAQVKLVVMEFLRFKDIVAIDTEGDSLYNCPHVFAEFRGESGPFSGFVSRLRINEHFLVDPEELTKIDKFPIPCPPVTPLKVRTDKTLQVSESFRSHMDRTAGPLSLYDVDGRYSFLTERDVLVVDGTNTRSRGGSSSDDNQTMVVVTNIRHVAENELPQFVDDNPGIAHDVGRQIGRALESRENLAIYELKLIYSWQLTERSLVPSS